LPIDSLFAQHAEESDCRWVTIRGNPVCIKEVGKDEKGPGNSWKRPPKSKGIDTKTLNTVIKTDPKKVKEHEKWLRGHSSLHQAGKNVEDWNIRDLNDYVLAKFRTAEERNAVETAVSEGDYARADDIQLAMFLRAEMEAPKIFEAFRDRAAAVEAYNNLLSEKAASADKFYRFVSLEELDNYVKTGELQSVRTDYVSFSVENQSQYWADRPATVSVPAEAVRDRMIPLEYTPLPRGSVSYERVDSTKYYAFAGETEVRVVSGTKLPEGTEIEFTDWVKRSEIKELEEKYGKVAKLKFPNIQEEFTLEKPLDGTSNNTRINPVLFVLTKHKSLSEQDIYEHIRDWYFEANPEKLIKQAKTSGIVKEVDGMLKLNSVDHLLTAVHDESECHWVTIRGNRVCIRDSDGYKERKAKEAKPKEPKTFRKALNYQSWKKMRLELTGKGENSVWDTDSEIKQMANAVNNESYQLTKGSDRDVSKMNISEQELQKAGIPQVAEPLVPFERWLEYKSRDGNPYEGPNQERQFYEIEMGIKTNPETGEQYIVYGGYSWHGGFKLGEPLPDTLRKEIYVSEMVDYDRRPQWYTKDELDELTGRYKRFDKDNMHIPAVQKISELNAKAQEWNQKWEQHYQETPSFFRGTAIAELNEYKRTGTIGGDKNRYSYVAVSADPALAATFSQGVMIEFDGDSVRERGARVEYEAKPVPLGVSSSIDAESIGKPMKITYAHELEARLPEGTKYEDLNIKSIIIGPEVLRRYRPELFDGREPNMDKIQAEFGAISPNIIINHGGNGGSVLPTIYSEGIDYDKAADFKQIFKESAAAEKAASDAKFKELFLQQQLEAEMAKAKMTGAT
jgi:hypothetical protein